MNLTNKCLNIINKVFKRISNKLLSEKNYRESYSQCGEDIIIDYILCLLQIDNPVYMDIGANEPKKLNNTYFFYKYRNGKGVLIEPNPSIGKKLKSTRPKDILYNCGIGFNNIEEQAYYYVMDWHEFNTFSKDIAYETQEIYKGRNNIKSVLNLKLLGINQILENHFQGGLDILSIDVEGLDLEIIKSANFEICTPKIICIETKITSNQNIDEISIFLFSKGYKLFAYTPINGIYVHHQYLNLV